MKRMGFCFRGLLLATLAGATGAGCSEAVGGPPVTPVDVGLPDAGGEDEGEGDPGCIDPDGDGHGQGVSCLGADCREGDPQVYAGAPERCNNQDDDCDGLPDACECTPYLGTAECPEGEHCDVEGNPAVARCVSLPGGSLADDGQPCGPASCRPGSQCVNWGEQALCTHTCDPYTGEGCTAPQECLNHLERNEAIGLCREPPPACNIYESGTCARGLACRPFFRTFGDPDLRCQTAGPRQVGQTCGGDEGECLPNLLCIRHADAAEKLCFRVCEDDDACIDPETSCQGRTFTLDIGYCL